MGYITVLTTSDSVLRTYEPSPGMGELGGSSTNTTMNFNQSDPNGLGTNSIGITGGDGS